MKNININELQDNASKFVKETETGAKFIISRYSKPVAVLLSVDEFEALENHNCKECIADFRKIAKKVEEK